MLDLETCNILPSCKSLFSWCFFFCVFQITSLFSVQNMFIINFVGNFSVIEYISHLRNQGPKLVSPKELLYCLKGCYYYTVSLTD